MHVDNLGSVDVLTDETGAVVERRSYDAFGERRNPTWGGPPLFAAGKTSRGFTGHEDDEELELVNMRGTSEGTALTSSGTRCGTATKRMAS